jgi:hypothetical protein
VLEIRRENNWELVDTEDLVIKILDGEFEKDTPSRIFGDQQVEKPLQDYLDHLHCIILSELLLDRIHALYDISPKSVSIDELLSKAKQLCEWKWNVPGIESRLVFVCGWLSEVKKEYKQSIDYYNRYLNSITREPLLTILALNNRGVLNIRLGFSSGVADLLNAGIAIESSEKKMNIWKKTEFYPAFFNLLVLINICLQRQLLRGQVDVILTNFVRDLPDNITSYWIGRCLSKEEKESIYNTDNIELVKSDSPENHSKNTTDSTKSVSDDTDGSNKDEEKPAFSMLYGNDFTPLNTLRINFAQEVKKNILSPDDIKSYKKPIFWPKQEMDVSNTSFNDAYFISRNYLHVVEAAGLLFDEDVPIYFTDGQESVILGAIEVTKYNLEKAEKYIIEGEYQLAEDVLSLTLNAITPLQNNAEIKKYIVTINNKLLFAKEAYKQRTRLYLIKEYAELDNTINSLFASNADYLVIKREGEDLLSKIDAVEQKIDKAKQKQCWDHEVVPTLAGMKQRVESHLSESYKDSIREKVREPQILLQEQWPNTCTGRSLEDYLKTIEQCKQWDPRNLIDNWDVYEDSLKKHYARLHLNDVKEQVSSGNYNKDDIVKKLKNILEYDRSVITDMLPTLSLLYQSTDSSNQTDSIRASLVSLIKDLLYIQPLDRDRSWSAVARSSIISIVCKRLYEFQDSYLNVGDEIFKILDDLESSFSEIIADGRPEAVESAEQLLLSCLDACPVYNAGDAAPSCPRNPILILLEKCRKSKHIGLGEYYLNKYIDYDKSAMEFRTALDLHLDNKDFLRRAVLGLLLSKCDKIDRVHKESYVKQLETWIDECVGSEQLQNMTSSDIEEKISEIMEITNNTRPDPPINNNDNQNIKEEENDPDLPQQEENEHDEN